MRKLLIIACFVLALAGAKAQTTAYTYGPGNCTANTLGGGACNLWYFAATSNPATAPIIFYIPGGGYTNTPDLGCTTPNLSAINLNSCIEFTDWTRHGFDVYELRYPVYTDTITNPSWPAGGQAAACALATASVNAWPGNWQNVTIMGDSAGGGIALVIHMAPVGKYLTDGNANCGAVNNTNWTTVKAVTNSATVCMDGATNCYCNASTSPSPSRCNEVFGSTGPLPLSTGAQAQAYDASALYYVSSWVAKGCKPIYQWTSLTDGTVPPAQQELLPAATAAAGCPTFEYLYNGMDHLGDQGCKNAAGGGPAWGTGCWTWPVPWPPALTSYSTAGSGGCGTGPCNVLGVVFRYYSQALYGVSARNGSNTGSNP